MVAASSTAMLSLCQRWLSERFGTSSGAVYFATWRTSSWQEPLTPQEREVVTRVLKVRRDPRYELLAFVVMDDHVHVLVRTRGVAVNQVLESMKTYSAHKLREMAVRTGAIWQRDTFERLVRDQEDLRKRTDYIVSNPWKRWPFTEGYPWVWEAGGATRRRLAAAS